MTDSAAPARVVFWAGSFERAGTQRFLVELLRRLDRRAFAPVVFSTRADGELLPVIESLGVSVHEFGTGRTILSPATFSGLWGAARFLRRERVDVLCCMLGITTLFGPFVGRMAGVPVVVNAQRNLGYWLRGRLKESVYGYVSRRMVDGILVNNTAARDELSTRFRVPPERVHETHGGVDVRSISDAVPAESVRRELGLEGARVVVCVGKLSRVKNHGLFLRAAALVAEGREDVVFLIVGDGPLRGELSTLAGRLGLSGRVRLAGRREDVPALLKLTDVFVMPSSSEGLPNAVMEAMAAGLPVVATRVGGIPELITDGESGRLVAPGDAEAMARAVGELLDDRDLAERMGRAGLETVREGYDIESAVGRFEDVLRELLGAARAK